MNTRKRRIAYFGVGPIATGPYGDGIPPLVELLRRLTDVYDITVYSLLQVDKSKVPNGIKVKTSVLNPSSLKIKMIILVSRFYLDHLFRPFDLLQGLAAYPSGWTAAKLGKLFHLPSIAVFHAGEVMEIPELGLGDILNKKLKRNIKWVCEHTDSLIVLSKFQYEGLEKNFHLGQGAKIIPFGVDTDSFRFFEKSLEPPYYFLHVAYCHPVKGQEMLLKTFKKIKRKKNVKLLILGDNHIDGETERLVELLNLKEDVELLGSYPNQELLQFYHKAHFLLHTSKYESQGISIMEAMATGTVVCSTNVGIVAELSSEVCISVNDTESELLASKIMDVMDDEKRYKSMQLNARNWVVKHNINATVSKYREMYDELLTNG